MQGNRSSSLKFLYESQDVKNNVWYRKPGVLVSIKPCICNSLDQSPTVESDRLRDMGGDFHSSVHTDLYTLVYLIPFSDKGSSEALEAG